MQVISIKTKDNLSFVRFINSQKNVKHIAFQRIYVMFNHQRKMIVYTVNQYCIVLSREKIYKKSKVIIQPSYYRAGTFRWL